MSSNQMAIEIQQELRRIPGNNKCVDCNAPYPQWATVSYGTFMCLECSGRHRGLGVHISFVRSVTMDSWTAKQIKQMQSGGNATFREAFDAAGVPITLSIQEKYNTLQAEAYRKRLIALVEGNSVEPLPKWDPSCLKSSITQNEDSNDVEALNGESNEDHVARQNRLRAEARARMQAKFGGNGMQGIGSGGDPNAQSDHFNATNLSSAFSFLTSTVTSAASTAASIVREQELGNKVTSGWSLVQNSLHDSSLAENVKTGAFASWSALSSATNEVWKTAQGVVNAPQKMLSPTALNEIQSNLPRTAKYSGVSSDSQHVSDNHSSGNADMEGTMHERDNQDGFENVGRPIDSDSAVAREMKEEKLATSILNCSNGDKKKEVDFFAEYGF